MKLKKKFKVLFTFIIVLGLGFAFGPKIYNKYLKNSSIKETIKNASKVIKEEKKDEVYTLDLIAGGDGLVHNAVRYSAIQDDGTYDFNEEFDYIKDILKEYDLVYYNQESMINGTTDYLENATGLYFNTPAAFADATINAGFNLISLANNHSMDTGKSGALGSVKFWNEKKENNDIMVVGMNDSDEMVYDYSKNIGTKNNITYGFLSYTTSTNGNSVPNSYLVDVYSDERAKTDIEALKDKVDVIIVAMHWGAEYILKPNDQETEIANYLNSLGVDIIIGNHAHCIQPIDIIKNEQTGNETVVFYALGNLISNQSLLTYLYPDQYGQKVMIGALGTLRITKTITQEGETSIKIDNVGADLTYNYVSTPAINLSKERKYYVIPFSKMKSEYLTVVTSKYQGENGLELLYNDYKDILLSLNDTIKVEELGSKLN